MRKLRIEKSITNRDDEILNLYLKDVARRNMISKDEEIELSKRIQNGDQIALNKLVEGNLRFVISVAKQYKGKGLDLNDLISEGNIGLIKAAKRFDPDKGYKFISYAVWWIRQSILEALNGNDRNVRVPINQLVKANKIKKIIEEFEQKYERKPSYKEVGDIMNISEEDVSSTLASVTKSVSISTPVSEDTILEDVIPNQNIEPVDSKLMKESLRYRIEGMINQFHERDRDILKMYFGLFGIQQLNLDEISKRFGLTTERIRQLKDRCINELQTKYSDKIKKVI